jgi:hypothetical protein
MTGQPEKNRRLRPWPHATSSDRQAAGARRQHYLKLADAQALIGDSVARENYLQHPEHFFRHAAELDGAR